MCWGVVVLSPAGQRHNAGAAGDGAEELQRAWRARRRGRRRRRARRRRRRGGPQAAAARGHHCAAHARVHPDGESRGAWSIGVGAHKLTRQSPHRASLRHRMRACRTARKPLSPPFARTALRPPPPSRPSHPHTKPSSNTSTMVSPLSQSPPPSGTDPPPEDTPQPLLRSLLQAAAWLQPLYVACGRHRAQVLGGGYRATALMHLRMYSCPWPLVPAHGLRPPPGAGAGRWVPFRVRTVPMSPGADVPSAPAPGSLALSGRRCWDVSPVRIETRARPYFSC